MPVAKPEILKVRFSKDFGTGFYCTEIMEQAKRGLAASICRLSAIMNTKKRRA